MGMEASSDISESPSMVKFVSFKCGELGPEFIENEIISLKLVFVVENKRWPRCMMLGTRLGTGKIPLIAALVVLSTFSLNRIEDVLRFGV